MVGPLILALTLAASPRLDDCLRSAEAIFGPNNPPMAEALCLTQLELNDTREALLVCVDEGTEPCPEPVVRPPSAWPVITAGAVGVAVGVIATALAFSL